MPYYGPINHSAFQEPAPVDAVTEKLSPREREILDLVADGYTSKEVADKLSITISTVCWNLDEIYKKLHVHSRVQAINKLRQSQRVAGNFPGHV